MSQSSISHILYITTGSRGCESALSILKQYPVLKKEIHVQDIKLIERPSWLRGVPVLAKVSTREIWEGTASIEQLYYLAGYFSGMNTTTGMATNGMNTAGLNTAGLTTTNTQQQPWSSYQTNLTLASPTSVPAAPTPATVSESLPSPPPLSNQPSQPNQPFPPAPVPTNAPVMSVSTPMPVANSTTPSSNQPVNPDKVQALPLPDELRPKQELVLPPLPKNIKAEQVTTQAPQPRLSESLNQTPLVPPPPNQTPASSIPLQSTIRSNVTQDGQSPANEPAPVFTPQEVDQIQRVMFKPKTVNKRRDTSEHNSPQTTTPSSTVRVFPVSEKRHATVVEKEDIREYVNSDEENNHTLSPIREMTSNVSNDEDELSTGSGGA